MKKKVYAIKVDYYCWDEERGEYTEALYLIEKD